MFHRLRSAGGVDLGDHHDIPEQLPDGVQIVASVRNHFDWFVSSWIKSTWRSRHSALQTLPFPQWLERIHEPDCLFADFTFPGYVMISADNHQLYGPLWSRCDVLLRYEDLEMELDTLLGAEAPALQRINTTPHKKDYRQYYSQALREQVVQRYGEEMAELGYDFDNGRQWLPRDDSAPLMGGGLFNANNVRRTGLREYTNWPNLQNNPE